MDYITVVIKVCFFFCKWLGDASLFAQHNFAKNQEDNRKDMLQHIRPRVIETGWNFFGRCGRCTRRARPQPLDRNWSTWESLLAVAMPPRRPTPPSRRCALRRTAWVQKLAPAAAAPFSEVPKMECWSYQ